MAKTFGKRVHSAQRNSGVTSGFENDWLHVSGAVTGYSVTPSGGYSFVSMVVNTIPGNSGYIELKVGNDTLAIVTPTAPREFKYNCYLSDALTVSVTDAAADITFIVSKG